MNSPIADHRIEAVLRRLHAQDRRQFWAILRHYLPGMLITLLTGREVSDGTSPAEAAFLRDKMVALDPNKAHLAYILCRSLDACCAVEVGTSFGVSTIYLAAALRDNSKTDTAADRPRRVIGTEIEPTKVTAARANLTEAGVDRFVDILEGDALKTLKTIEGPVDFVLVDTWIPLALPALQLIVPKLRPGAVVMCDNTQQFAKDYRPYTDYVRDPANGFRSMLWPKLGGIELSVWEGTHIGDLQN